MMRLEVLNPSLGQQYDDFLLTRPETLLYHSRRYQNMVAELLKCRQNTLLAIDELNCLQAVLPLMSKEGIYGTVYNSLPYYGSNGSLIGNNPLALSMLMDAYQDIIKDKNTASATIIENPLSPLQIETDFQLTDERIGQFTPLPNLKDPSDNLMASFHQKTRNMVRKSSKNGVKVAIENNAMPFLINVHQENMREIGGMAKSRNFFEALPEYFTAGRDFQIYVARLNDEPVAALLVFFYNCTAEYYTPVVRKEFRDTQALSAIIFQAMCDAAKEGFSWWNWGGTWITQEGVYRFKSRWGTQDKHYRYFTYIGNKQLMNTKRDSLLEAYPGFFVLPFSALTY